MCLLVKEILLLYAIFYRTDYESGGERRVFKKLILVIDDPISSFDFENKVGIMSLLKAKVADIIKTNPESQILV